MKKGFTLLEVIIVLGIFSIVSIVSVDTYINGFRSEQRAALQNKVMQDARLILNILSDEISQSQIDYDEYFNQCVILGACPIADFPDLDDPEDLDVLEETFYGQNHGYYSWQFFHGGYSRADRTGNEDGYGSLCQTNGGGLARYPDVSCITGPLAFSEDSNTGVNPANNDLTDLTETDEASAFCANNTFKLFGTSEILTEGVSSDDSQRNCASGIPRVFSELYLINSVSNRKIIIGKGLIGEVDGTDDFAVKKIHLEPIDIESTQNLQYPVSIYGCASEYSCTETTVDIVTTNDTVDELGQPISVVPRDALYSNTENIYQNFVPISPLSVNVVDLKFIISPEEDPYRAYREERLGHPKVTIILEIEPSTRFRMPFFSERFNLKLQTTVATSRL